MCSESEVHVEVQGQPLPAATLYERTKQQAKAGRTRLTKWSPGLLVEISILIFKEKTRREEMRLAELSELQQSFYRKRKRKLCKYMMQHYPGYMCLPSPNLLLVRVLCFFCLQGHIVADWFSFRLAQSFRFGK